MSSYSSIQHVFEKINKDGSFSKIYSFFQQLFDQEQKFAYNHIINQQKKQKNDELRHQLINNLAIFKDNIEIIVRDIIDKIWQDTKAEIAQKNPFHFVGLNVEKIEEMDEEYDTTKRSMINLDDLNRNEENSRLLSN